MIANYNIDDIIFVLKEVGLKNADDVFIHSNLGFFGVCGGINNKQELCAAFYTAFHEIIGNNGTIIVPTFTYSGCHGEIFNAKCTPHSMGMFSDYIMHMEESIRSDDPNFSVSAIGANASYYTANPPANSFGHNCFFERLLSKNGKICCMNFDAGTTFVHYVERCLSVPYRYDKKFSSEVIINEKHENRDSYHFVYSYEKPEDAPVFERLHEIAIRKEVAKTATLGKGLILLESSADLYELIKNTMVNRPRFLLKEE